MLQSRKRTIGKLVFAIILGGVLGSLVGQAVGLVLPDSVVKEFFMLSADPGFSPTTIWLGAFTLTLGFTLHFNVGSVIGVAIAIYILRWY